MPRFSDISLAVIEKLSKETQEIVYIIKDWLDNIVTFYSRPTRNNGSHRVSYLIYVCL